MAEGCRAHGKVTYKLLERWGRAGRHGGCTRVFLASTGGQGEHEPDFSLFWREAWEVEDDGERLEAGCEGFYTRAFVMNKRVQCFESMKIGYAERSKTHVSELRLYDPSRYSECVSTKAFSSRLSFQRSVERFAQLFAHI